MTNHLVFANMVTSADRQNLPKNHPIRRLLKPFTHGTPTVNLGAQLFLTTENGLLHRAVSLSFDGVRDALLTGLAARCVCVCVFVCVCVCDVCVYVRIGVYMYRCAYEYIL